MRRRLISSRESITAAVQHTEPCSDCPLRRNCLPRWLGGATVDEYLRLLHSDFVVPCHVIRNQQCAGVAIYRANVLKRCDPPNLRLPKDKVNVFGWPTEFREHHKEK